MCNSDAGKTNALAKHLQHGCAGVVSCACEGADPHGYVTPTAAPDYIWYGGSDGMFGWYAASPRVSRRVRGELTPPPPHVWCACQQDATGHRARDTSPCTVVGTRTTRRSNRSSTVRIRVGPSFKCHTNRGADVWAEYPIVGVRLSEPSSKEQSLRSLEPLCPRGIEVPSPKQEARPPRRRFTAR